MYHFFNGTTFSLSPTSGHHGNSKTPTSTPPPTSCHHISPAPPDDHQPTTTSHHQRSSCRFAPPNFSAMAEISVYSWPRRFGIFDDPFIVIDDSQSFRRDFVSSQDAAVVSFHHEHTFLDMDVASFLHDYNHLNRSRRETILPLVDMDVPIFLHDYNHLNRFRRETIIPLVDMAVASFLHDYNRLNRSRRETIIPLVESNTVSYQNNTFPPALGGPRQVTEGIGQLRIPFQPLFEFGSREIPTGLLSVWMDYIRDFQIFIFGSNDEPVLIQGADYGVRVAVGVGIGMLFKHLMENFPLLNGQSMGLLIGVFFLFGGRLLRRFKRNFGEYLMRFGAMTMGISIIIGIGLYLPLYLGLPVGIICFALLVIALILS